MNKALVTGGAGFIGSGMVQRLLKNGFEVTVIDDFSTGRKSNLSSVISEIRLVEGDIRNGDLVEDLCKGNDVVFHLAAIPSVPRSVAHPKLSHEVNLTGTLSMLVAARNAGVRRFVYAGSSSAYGENPSLPKMESNKEEPLSPYAVSKLSGEWYCRIFNRLYGLETVVLRFFNVFGPRQDPASEYAAVIPRFILALAGGKPPVIYGDGKQSRDFTYVDNIIDANLLASEVAGVEGEVFNIACGLRYSLLELLSELEGILDCSVEPEFQPARPGDIKHSQADIRKAKKELGFEPAVGFTDGLKKTVEFFVG